MDWVLEARRELEKGQRVKVRPRGSSMRGRIEDGQLVTLVPAQGLPVAVNDAVLVRVQDHYLLHLVRKIRRNRLLIGNALGKLNGWVKREDVLGKVVEVGE